MTPEQQATLEALADQIVTAVNEHDHVPYVEFRGRVGIQTDYRCKQARPEDNSAFSVDTTDPTAVWIELGDAAAGKPLTGVKVFISAHNTGQPMVGIDVTAQGGSDNQPIVQHGGTPAPAPAPTPAATELVSADGRFLAVQQTDGNFVVYLRAGMTPLWDSQSWDRTK